MCMCYCINNVKGIWVNIYMCMYMNFMCVHIHRLSLEKITSILFTIFPHTHTQTNTRSLLFKNMLLSIIEYIVK